jgi:hypothetical protein
VKDILYEFLGCEVRMRKEAVVALLRGSTLSDAQYDDAIRLLAWFGFLGVEEGLAGVTRFSYDIGYDMVKLLRPIEKGSGARFVVHPAFRSALECLEDGQ